MKINVENQTIIHPPFFIFIIGTFLSVATSCSGRNPEKEREDSISTADSIAVIEVAIQETEQVRINSIQQDSIENATAGLTFQTFTSPKKMEMGDVTLQLFSPLKTITSNLISLGFELFDTKTFTRNDYFDESGESYVTVRLDNYKKWLKIN